MTINLVKKGRQIAARFAPVALALVVSLGLALLATECGGGSSNNGGGPPPPTINVTVTPATVTVSAGATQQFAATVTGTTNTAVNWSATAGSISTNGLYTAPNPPPSSGAATVTATSQADAAASASAAVTISAIPVSCNFPSANSVAVTAGQTTSGVDVAVPTLTPSLSITAVGLNNSAGAATAQVQQNSSATLLIAGSGITAAAAQSCLIFQISGPGDVQVTQPASSSFATCMTQGGGASTPCVQVGISIAASAAPGGRNILVTNGKEVAVFVGGLLVTNTP